jgi:nucleoid-associated protein YgaU
MSVQGSFNATVNVDIDAGDVAADTLLNAKIVPVMPPGMPIIFSFNPKSIKFSRQADTTSQGQAQTGTTPTTPRRVRSRTVTFTAYLEGPQTQTMGSGLHDMMTPGGGLFGKIASLITGINLTRPPSLMFVWGSLTMMVNMTRCDINYTRFHLATGMPLRAEAAITLQEVATLLDALTNPTSGGLPGREERVVSAGENLVNISTGTYGRPTYWRQIADTNGIDDPFRVKPGDVIYLPSPLELRQTR